MSRISMSHVHVYKWLWWRFPAAPINVYIKPNSINIHHVTHVNESCHTCQCVMSHTYQSLWWKYICTAAPNNMYIHIMSHMSHACHAYQRVMYIYISDYDGYIFARLHRIASIYISCHTCHTHVNHVTHVNESCHTCQCVMSHTYQSMW